MTLMLFSVGVGASLSTHAQKIVDNQTWLDYTLQKPIGKRLTMGGEIGFRGIISNRNWNQMLIRPTITYRFKKPFSLAAAMAWFGTFNQQNYNVNEFRIHQDFNAKGPNLGFVTFFYRLRLEQRFFFYQEFAADNFKVRGRALVGMETRDLTWLGEKRPIYFQTILEGFKTLYKSEAIEVFINQTRWHLSFGHRLSHFIRYEFHYIAQRSRLFSKNGSDADQNIFRLRIFHKI